MFERETEEGTGFVFVFGVRRPAEGGGAGRAGRVAGLAVATATVDRLQFRFEERAQARVPGRTTFWSLGRGKAMN